MSQFVGLRYNGRNASRALLVPAGSNFRDPIRGLAKLFFRFFTVLAKTLTVQVRGQFGLRHLLSQRNYFGHFLQ